MRKVLQRMVGAMLICCLIVTMLAISDRPVMAATSGRGYGGCITARINDSLLCRCGRQYATIKVKFKNRGWLNCAQVHVLMLDENNRWICEYNIKSNRVNTFRLGDDHRVYKIYFKAPCASQRYTGLESWWLTYNKDCRVY